MDDEVQEDYEAVTGSGAESSVAQLKRYRALGPGVRGIESGQTDLLPDDDETRILVEQGLLELVDDDD